MNEFYWLLLTLCYDWVFCFVLSPFLEYLEDSDDDIGDDDGGNIRRACSLSDLNNLPATNGSSTGRRKRSFHRHRNNGVYIFFKSYPNYHFMSL